MGPNLTTYAISFQTKCGLDLPEYRGQVAVINSLLVPMFSGSSGVYKTTFASTHFLQAAATSQFGSGDRRRGTTVESAY